MLIFQWMSSGGSSIRSSQNWFFRFHSSVNSSLRIWVSGIRLERVAWVVRTNNIFGVYITLYSNQETTKSRTATFCYESTVRRFKKTLIRDSLYGDFKICNSFILKVMASPLVSAAGLIIKFLKISIKLKKKYQIHIFVRLRDNVKVTEWLAQY